MKMEDFFNNTDESTANRIAEKYPVLSDEEKERLFAMSKRKYNINKTEFTNANEVSGVEKYSRPKWYKAVSVAAAAVLAVGGIGGGMALISRNGQVTVSSSQVSEGSVEASETEETTEAAVEEATEPLMSEDEYKAIAAELTDNFLEISNIIRYSSDISTDVNDCLSYYIYDSENQKWTEDYSFYANYYRVTDERFKNYDDIYNAYKKYISAANCKESYKDVVMLENECGLVGYLGGDTSEYPSGSSIDVAQFREDDANRIGFSNYIMYNGALYSRVNVVESAHKPKFSTEPKVYNLKADSFTISRYILMPYAKEYWKYGEERIYNVVLEDGEWKIDSIDTGLEVEYSAAAAIQCYFEHKEEYNDVDIMNNNDINAEITEFDENTKKSKAHAVLKDINGNDAVEITADIDVEKFEVIDAEVTRLNERDESLKRPDVLWRENYLDKMARAVVKYIENNDEYKDMNLDLDIDHIYTKVYECDDNAGTCTGHATVNGLNGSSGLDWYVAVDLNTETVTSCQNHNEVYGEE